MLRGAFPCDSRAARGARQQESPEPGRAGRRGGLGVEPGLCEAPPPVPLSAPLSSSPHSSSFSLSRISHSPQSSSVPSLSRYPSFLFPVFLFFDPQTVPSSPSQTRPPTALTPSCPCPATPFYSPSLPPLSTVPLPSLPAFSFPSRFPPQPDLPPTLPHAPLSLLSSCRPFPSFPRSRGARGAENKAPRAGARRPPALAGVPARGRSSRRIPPRRSDTARRCRTCGSATIALRAAPLCAVPAVPRPRRLCRSQFLPLACDSEAGRGLHAFWGLPPLSCCGRVPFGGDGGVERAGRECWAAVQGSWTRSVHSLGVRKRG
nr:vegetative cell wall protein gp1-like [Taeniopygia guttata]